VHLRAQGVTATEGSSIHVAEGIALAIGLDFSNLLATIRPVPTMRSGQQTWNGEAQRVGARAFLSAAGWSGRASEQFSEPWGVWALLRTGMSARRCGRENSRGT